jgi:hypothetical protein
VCAPLRRISRDEDEGPGTPASDIDEEVNVGSPKYVTQFAQGEFVFAENVKEAIGMFNLMIPWHRPAGEDEDLIAEAAAIGEQADRFRRSSPSAEASQGDTYIILGDANVPKLPTQLDEIADGAATPESEPSTPRSIAASQARARSNESGIEASLAAPMNRLPMPAAE